MKFAVLFLLSLFPASHLLVPFLFYIISYSSPGLCGIVLFKFHYVRESAGDPIALQIQIHEVCNGV